MNHKFNLQSNYKRKKCFTLEFSVLLGNRFVYISQNVEMFRTPSRMKKPKLSIVSSEIPFSID